MWSIFVTFRDFGNKAKPARNAKLRKFEERDEKWSHSMAAADKWERGKDDFRKDSGSFCGSCTEWVRRLLWGWWVLFGGRDVRARGGARQPPNGRRPRGPFGGGAPPPRAAAARRRAAAQRPPGFSCLYMRHTKPTGGRPVKSHE